MSDSADKRIKIWDLPTRIFHWSMVGLFTALILTGEFIEDWTEIHFYLGYTLSGLIIFRILWGILGSHHAKFKNFIYSPIETFNYLKSHAGGEPKHYYGHNPLGALMVFALIGSIALQLASGLSITDDVLYDAPFYAMLPGDITDLAGTIHHTLPDVLLALVALHILAVVVHKVFFKDNLVPAMIHGKKTLLPTTEAVAQAKPSLWAFVLSAGLAAGWVYYLFSIPI